MKYMLDFDPFCPLVGHLFPWEGGGMGKVVALVVASPYQYEKPMGELKSKSSWILFNLHL